MNPNMLSEESDSITVETVEFPFEMSPPEFASAQMFDDTVTLRLEDIIADSQENLIFKGQVEAEVNLISQSPPQDAGIVNSGSSGLDGKLDGFHYYTFDGGLTLYSEYSVNVILI